MLRWSVLLAFPGQGCAVTVKTDSFSPHGRIGTKSEKTVLSGYTNQVDSLLRSNVTNAKVIFGRLRKDGTKEVSLRSESTSSNTET